MPPMEQPPTVDHSPIWQALPRPAPHQADSMKLTTCFELAAVAVMAAHADAQVTDNIDVLEPSTNDCSFVCADVFVPVCGSDGVTYSNECYLSLADCGSLVDITKVQDGECPTTGTLMPEASESPIVISAPVCPNVCPAIFRPVCGSDGVTYPNDCALAVAQCESGVVITQVSDGECSVVSSSTTEDNTAGCPEVCFDLFSPVCGSDGVTYSNSCFLGIATCKDPSITQVRVGACIDIDNPPTDPASEGTTTPLRPPEVTVIVGNTPTDPIEDTSVDTTATVSPPEVILGVGNIPTDPIEDTSVDTTMPVSMPLAENTECSEVCIEILKPVCGSDGVTYPNTCFLGIATCKDPSITQVSEGACTATEGDDANSATTDLPTEVTNEDTPIPQNLSLPFCPDVCLTIFLPVCGSDGVTYSNSCKLAIANCNNPELLITQVSDGACPSKCNSHQ